MRLSVYIAELLKSNDCVIVPDLGGFIANYQSSDYDLQGDQFFPPSKEIIFSNKLKKNDGLLVNFVGEKEGVGYLEARKIVSEFVSEILFRLENGERVEFERTGTLYIDQNDHLLFDPAPIKHVRADSYGLDSFHFPPLVNKYNQPPKQMFRDKDPEPQRRNRPVLKYVLIGLPLLAALYFVPVKKLLNHNDSNKLSTTNTASLSVTDTPVSLTPGNVTPSTANLSGQKAEEIAPTAEKTQSAEPTSTVDNAPVKPVISSAEVSKQQIKSEPIISRTPSTGKFHIVGGCFKVKENAEKLAEKLIQQGYHAQVSAMGRGFFRVSVESYQTRREAEQGLGKILEADPETGYWLMADKK